MAIYIIGASVSEPHTSCFTRSEEVGSAKHVTLAIPTQKIALGHIDLLVCQTDDPGPIRSVVLAAFASSDARLSSESELHPEFYPELHWRWP